MTPMLCERSDYYTNHICDCLFYETVCRVQHPDFSDRHAGKMASFIMKNTSKIKRLSFYNCPKLGPNGIERILDALHERRLQNLSQLEISSVSITDQGLLALAKSLFPEEKDEIVTTIIGTLELEDIGRIKQSTWNSFLPRALNNNTRFHHLKTLDLTHNNLTIQSVQILVESLTTNGTLQNLILSENPMIGDEGTRLISQALNLNSTLKVLSLAVCNITNKGIRYLADCLQGHNTTLSRLYLFGNPYDHESKDKVQLTYWLDLNACGRQTFQKTTTSTCRISMISQSLAKAAQQNRHDIIYGLLKESPHVWIP